MSGQQQKIILITGANSGIGQAGVKAIASHPEYHVLLASRSLSKGRDALEQVQSSSMKGSVSLLELDIDSKASIEAAVAEVSTKYGVVDALINNAAICFMGGQADLETELTKTFQTNVVGQALMTEAFLPLLSKSSDPSITYVTSGLGSMTRVTQADYGNYVELIGYRVSKAALNMLARHDYRRLKERGIKVHLWTPGLMISNLRGTSEEMRNFHGHAKPANTSGEYMLSIIRGEKDAHQGEFLSELDGICPW